MYMWIALSLLDNKVDIYNEDELKNALEKIHINIVYEAGVQHVFLDLVDVSEEIRSEKVGNMASTSTALPPVREKLLDLQRDMPPSQLHDSSELIDDFPVCHCRYLR